MYSSAVISKGMLLGGALLSLPVVATLSSPLAYAQSQGGEKASPDVLLDRPKLPEFVEGEVIVKMKGGATAALSSDIQALGLESTPAKTSGGEVIYRFNTQTMGVMQSKSKSKRRAHLFKIVEELNAHSAVEYAQPNWIFQPLDTVPNDTLYKDQWHYFNNGTGTGQSPGGINLPKTWDKNKGDSSVVVAVIDTGLFKEHEDISGANVVPGYDFISDANHANDGDGRDGDATDTGDAMKKGECGQGQPPQDYPSSFHGTHVAGTIGVVDTNNGKGLAGINWQVKVQPVRVLGKCGGTTADINDAIRWAAGIHVDGVPDNKTPAQVINMSLGGEIKLLPFPIPVCSFLGQSTQSAINDAVAKGVTVVVAAGNSAIDAAYGIPASCDKVITVAASDGRGHLVYEGLKRVNGKLQQCQPSPSDQECKFLYSNYGKLVEIMAPGGATWRDDNHDGKPDGVLSSTGRGDEYYNGTSMATPHVTGVAALIQAAQKKAGEPFLSPAEVLKKLQKNASPQNSTQCPKPCGAGLLNANIAE